MPLAAGTLNALLDALCRNVAFQNSALWIKLHTGDPTTAGTANPAANTTRKQAAFATAAAGGAISNTTAIAWLTVSNSETYSWISLWTASSGGTCRGSIQLNAPVAVTAGGDFTIAVGDLDLALA